MQTRTIVIGRECAMKRNNRGVYESIGALTSEYAAAKSSGRWGLIGFGVGALITVLSLLLPLVGAESSWGIVIGGAMSALGVVQKLLADLGYINSRTALKVAETQAAANVNALASPEGGIDIDLDAEPTVPGGAA